MSDDMTPPPGPTDPEDETTDSNGFGNGADEGPPPPGDTPEGSPPPGRPRRLARRTEDRVLAGVAGGLGDYFGVDPAVLRLAFVALAFFGGSGVVLYVLGWLLIPERTKTTSVGDDLIHGAGGGRSVVGIILILIAVAIAADNVPFFRGSLVWAAVLIAIGVLLFRTQDSRAANAAPSGSANPPPRPPEPTPTPSATSADTAPLPPASTTARTWRPTPYAPPRPPRDPSTLGRITIAGGLIAVGIAALLHNLEVVSLTPAQFIALGVTAAGIGLLVGALWGRARGLIALSTILVPPMLLLSILSVTADLSGGQRFYRPTTVADVQPRYQLTAGQLRIDLSEIELGPGERLEVDGEMGVGQLEVLVPADTGIEADASVGIGQASILRRSTAGTGVSLSGGDPGPEDAGTIVLDLETGIGEIDVRRAQEAAPEPSVDGDAFGARETLEFVAVDIDYREAPSEAPAGLVTFELDNEGSTQHNVVIEELGDLTVVEANGGGTASGQVELEPGTYTYYCSVAGHRAAGMEGTLTVREPTAEEGTR